MQIATLQAEKRDTKGTRAARRLRMDGRVPGVVYGHGQTPQDVAVVAHDLSTLLDHGTHVVELLIGQKKQRVLIREVQFDHFGDTPLHVDFAVVGLSEKVHLSVPLEFRGTAVGTHEGGVLDHGLVDLEVSCAVSDIPSSIRVNVSNMKLGDILHVRDLELEDGVTAVTPGEAIVCSVRAKGMAVEAEEVEGEEAEAAEPEIIGRKEKEAEESD